VVEVPEGKLARSPLGISELGVFAHAGIVALVEHDLDAEARDVEVHCLGHVSRWEDGDHIRQLRHAGLGHRRDRGMIRRAPQVCEVANRSTHSRCRLRRLSARSRVAADDVVESGTAAVRDSSPGRGGGLHRGSKFKAIRTDPFPGLTTPTLPPAARVLGTTGVARQNVGL
jgi:hypothetical protein